MEIPLKKRNRMERMTIACTLLTSIWEEVRKCNADEIESALLQNAVYAQTEINRIVWKLNVFNGGYPDHGQGEVYFEGYTDGYEEGYDDGCMDLIDDDLWGQDQVQNP